LVEELPELPLLSDDLLEELLEFPPDDLLEELLEFPLDGDLLGVALFELLEELLLFVVLLLFEFLSSELFELLEELLLDSLLPLLYPEPLLLPIREAGFCCAGTGVRTRPFSSPLFED
jgi:hypothetical protein